jgi:orotidine-5'-phosphate decarboxylase
LTQPAPIAVALDAPDLETAARWAALVTPHVSTVKVGLELYLRYGPEVVASIRGASGVKIFLDLKLHDIPATVTGAARAVARLRPELLTVHAAGGPEVIRAAVEGAPVTTIAAVTVLTSLNQATPGADRRAGADVGRRAEARRTRGRGRGAGAGVLAAGGGRRPGRGRPDITLITPGVRPVGSSVHDQARTATPEEALRAGANLL